MIAETMIEHHRSDYLPRRFAPWVAQYETTLCPKTTDEAAVRLLRLANHLRHTRGHRAFTFSAYAFFVGQAKCCPEEIGCGTAGCAIGELPFCFPDVFRLAIPCYDPRRLDIVLQQPIQGLGDPIRMAATWFGLDRHEAAHLFMPDHQCPTLFGGQHLRVNVTPGQVADNIDAFVKLRFPYAT